MRYSEFRPDSGMSGFAERPTEPQGDWLGRETVHPACPVFNLPFTHFTAKQAFPMTSVGGPAASPFFKAPG